MDGCNIVNDIIDCFTSLDELIQFAQANGIEHDPYVQLRVHHLSNQIPGYNCSICGESFITREKHELHQKGHEYIDDFDLSVLDSDLDGGETSSNDQPTKQKRRDSQSNEHGQPPDKILRLPTNSVSNAQFGAGDGGSMHTFRKKRERTYAKNGAIDTTYEVTFTDRLKNKNLIEISDELHNVFDNVLDSVREGSQDNSLARVVIDHKGLSDPIIVPLQKLDDMNASTVMDEIGKVLQSNDELPVDDSFSVTVGRIDLPSGGASLPISNLSGDNNSLTRKRSIVSRPSKTMCMPMAIVICFLKTCDTVSPQEWLALTKDETESTLDKILKHKVAPKWFYKHVLDKNRSDCFSAAKRLCELASVRTDKKCNITEISRFEDVLGIHILVISAKLGNKFIRIGENRPERKKLFCT